MLLTFAGAFLGTIGSVIGHGYIAISQHDHRNPKSLSEIAAAEGKLLRQFRWTALTNSTLLAITVYLLIAPRNSYGLAQSLAWSIEYLSGIMMLIFPARAKYYAFHDACALAMAVGMYTLAFLFLPALNGVFLALALTCIFAITVFGIATFLDKKRYIVHELGFIFVSHITVCVAALALR